MQQETNYNYPENILGVLTRMYFEFYRSVKKLID